MQGYILVDKPADWTSFDVVAKVRSLARVQTGNKKFKVGHSGTLDPFATGLLIILLGDYTKRQDEFMKLDKTYEVEAVLGKTSSTGDPEGELSEGSDSQPTLAQVQAALHSFTGEIQQTPPAHSAIKIDGQRAYKLARAGKAITLEPRTVTIHQITEVTYAYPRLHFTVSVSSGTYIRSLVADIGQVLGTGAYTQQLRRISIGEYGIEHAVPISELSKLLQSDKVSF